MAEGRASGSANSGAGAPGGYVPAATGGGRKIISTGTRCLAAASVQIQHQLQYRLSTSSSLVFYSKN